MVRYGEFAVGNNIALTDDPHDAVHVFLPFGDHHVDAFAVVHHPQQETVVIHHRH